MKYHFYSFFKLCDISKILINFSSRLTNDDFDSISDDIIKVFPKEVKETYYILPIRKCNSKDNRSSVARGKLVDKYKNKITFLRTAGILPHCRIRKESSENNVEISGTISRHAIVIDLYAIY